MTETQATHRDFLRIWINQALSQIGSQYSAYLLPLVAVVALEATPWEISLAKSARYLAFLLVAIPAGAIVDNYARKRVLGVATGLRSALFFVLAVALYFSQLGIWGLVATSFLIGVTVLFTDITAQSIIPTVVARSKLTGANSIIETTSQTARWLVPAAGGFVAAVLSLPAGLLICGIALAGAVIPLVGMRLPAPPQRSRLLAGSLDGLRVVLRDPLLRPISLSTAAMNLFYVGGSTFYPLIVLRDLGKSELFFALLLSVGAIGGIAGAAMAAWVARCLDAIRIVSISSVVYALSLFAYPAALLTSAWSEVFLAGGFFMTAFAMISYNVAQITLRQTNTRDDLLGRVNSAFRFLAWGSVPLGALLAGAVASAFSVPTALWLSAIGGILSSLALSLTIRRTRALSRSEGSTPH